MILKAHFCWGIFNKAGVWWEANVTQRVRKLVGGSLDPPPHCVTPLVLWPVRGEMDCPPLAKGQYCSGGSRSDPHSSVHYSFCNQAENNRTFWLSSKWKLSTLHFLKVLGALSSGKFICLFQDQKKSTRPGQWVHVGEQYASLLGANKSLEWFLGRTAKRRMFRLQSIISLAHTLM